MKKIKMTRNDVKASWHYVFGLGYCELQELLQGIDPIAYNSGMYGWNYDIYSITKHIAIVTGYRSFFSQNTRSLDSKFLNKYEEKAIAIKYNNDLDYKQKCKKLKSLRKKFIKELKEKYIKNV